MSEDPLVEPISPQDIFKLPSFSTQKPIKSTEKESKNITVLVKEEATGNAGSMKSNETEYDGTTSEMSVSSPSLSYIRPPWACVPEEGMGYKLEIVKNGTIVGYVDMDKRRNDSFLVIGRLPCCDIVLDHPSISRYHCILQYGEDLMDRSGRGWHLFDMGSTHGSKVNKNKLPPKQYVRARVGYVLQFGGSSRLISIVGPDSDRDPEYSLTKMKKLHKDELGAKLTAISKKNDTAKEERESEGIDWGLDYEENDDGPITVEMDPHLMEDREVYYNTDPKKALAKFFEREGFDMKFDFSEQGIAHNHKWSCSIELPIEISGIDRIFTAKATVFTSKKDAQFQCALEACRVLDSYGILRRTSMKIQTKNRMVDDDDFYEEDDDIYLDRTGHVEQQREKRKLWAQNLRGTNAIVKDTYESLCVKRDETRKMISTVQTQLGKLQKKSNLTEGSGDSLDEYCLQLSQETFVVDDMKTKTQKSVLRQKLVTLMHDAQHLEKLIKIAKPVPLPELNVANSGSSTRGVGKNAFLRKLMMVGRKNNTMGMDNSNCKGLQNETIEKPELGKTIFHSDKEESSPVYTMGPSKFSSETKIEKDLARNLTTLQEIGCAKEKSGELSTDPISAPKKRMRIRHKSVKQTGDEYGASSGSHDQYATWLPPDDQSGDGKTKLHEKFIGRY